MSELTPTRSAVIALRDEQRTMREGHAFLDEKCLLLAGATLLESRRMRALRAELRAVQGHARDALLAAVGRHGVDGLECYPGRNSSEATVAVQRRRLLGVHLQDAQCVCGPDSPPAAVNPSPEARACAAAFERVTALLVRIAAVSGNLARLHAEYRSTARRVRALEDVLLPEIGRDLTRIETGLEELEQDEAVWARFGRGALADPWSD